MPVGVWVIVVGVVLLVVGVRVVLVVVELVMFENLIIFSCCACWCACVWLGGLWNWC